MRTVLLGLLAALAAGATGCLPVPSVYPLVEERGLEVAGVEGEWRNGSEGFRIALESPGVYALRFDPEDDRDSCGGDPPRHRMLFVRLGGRLFADVQLEVSSTPCGELVPLLVPTHAICRVDLTGDSLVLAYLDDEWMREAIESRRVKVRHRRTGDDVLLLEETAGLRKLATRLAGTDEAFGGTETTYRRR